MGGPLQDQLLELGPRALESFLVLSEGVVFVHDCLLSFVVAPCLSMW